jgi:hypothetical protein
LAGIAKYLGIAGGLFACLGILGAISAISGSKIMAVILFGASGVALGYWGLSLSADIKGRYRLSSKIILTLGVLMCVSAVALMLAFFETLNELSGITLLGVICLPPAFYLAYKNKNQYLLILSLLGFFHWVGAWNSMIGRSAYGFDIKDPMVMSVIAAGAVGVGFYHEYKLYPRTGKFYLAWQSLGLLYFNMSLLILSIVALEGTDLLSWVIMLTVATIVQIVLGARFHSGLLRGFGIVFFTINIFTRFHEMFWDQLELGQYLSLGGLSLLVIGAFVEFFVRKLRKRGGINESH